MFPYLAIPYPGSLPKGPQDEIAPVRQAGTSSSSAWYWLMYSAW